MQGDQIKNSLKSSNKLNYLQPSSGKILKAIREEFGGQVHVPLYCDMAKGAVITLRPGIFEAHEFRSSDPQIIDQSDKAKPVEDAKCRFLKILEAEVGDVDISMQDILVSVGRGIENEENINLAKKLAEYLGGAMSCSRPVVDTNWMEKHRQVGTSGKTVKPKIYIALGISGAFQHLAGIKGNPFIMAINKNPTAPIFKVSKVGIVGDINTYLQKIIDKFTDCPH
jgi:electron transfer flavoprotein alpha subunit